MSDESDRDPVNDAWDALPAQVDIGEFTYDPTPEATALRSLSEATALRSLFGHSAFKHLGNTGAPAGDRELDGAIALQEHIAGHYLHAVEVHRSAPAAVLFGAFTKLRDRLIEADICLSCGDHTPGRSCQCENDE